MTNKCSQNLPNMHSSGFSVHKNHIVNAPESTFPTLRTHSLEMKMLLLNLPMSLIFLLVQITACLCEKRSVQEKALGCRYRKRRNCSACGLSLAAIHVQDLQRAPNVAKLALFEVRSCGGKLRFCSGNVRSLCGQARFIQESCCSVQNIDRIAQRVLQRSLNSFAKQPSSWLS